MVEMARRRHERPGFWMSPPRRLHSMARESPSPTLQPRFLVSRASPRPSQFFERGNRQTNGKGSISTRGVTSIVTPYVTLVRTEWKLANPRKKERNPLQRGYAISQNLFISRFIVYRDYINFHRLTYCLSPLSWS
jgi:hypothetical protein